MSQRLHFILIGLLGGLALWGLFDRHEMLDQHRLWLPLLVLAGSFFFGALAMTAELGLRRAMGFAALIGVVAAALSALKGIEFGASRQMLEMGHLLVAQMVLGAMPVPFAVAFGIEGRRGIGDYRILFIESWNIVVRYLAAWLFAGVVVLALWLMGALLDLVDVGVLSALLRDDLAMFLIVGGTLGLGMSVVAEMPDLVSPYLLLRLLRLLVVPVLVVVTVFVAAVPLRGLGALFGDLSVASALLATAIATIMLISIVVDQDEIEAAQAAVLTWSARGLTLLLPVLAGLALWALALRVRQYGWTPERVAALTLALVVAGYALCYLIALSTGRRWMEKVRQANVAMALAIIGLALLWLTPLISPERIALRSQLARFDAGQMRVDQLPLWQMQHEWGRAGAAALDQLRAQAPQDPELARQLAKLAEARTRWDMVDPDFRLPTEQIDSLRAHLRVVPEGTPLPADLLAALSKFVVPPEAQDCAQPLSDGLPACVLVLLDLTPDLAGPEALFVNGHLVTRPLQVFVQDEGGWRPGSPIVIGPAGLPPGAELIAELLRAPVVTAPVQLNSVQVGGWQISAGR